MSMSTAGDTSTLQSREWAQTRISKQMETQMEREAATQEKIDESMEEETHGRIEQMLLIHLIGYYFGLFSQSYP